MTKDEIKKLLKYLAGFRPKYSKLLGIMNDEYYSLLEELNFKNDVELIHFLEWEIMKWILET